MKKLFLIFLLLASQALCYAQGSLVWQKYNRIPYGQQMKTAVQSQSKRFWVGVSMYDDKPNDSGSHTSAVAIRDDTGDTLWYRRFWNIYPVISEGWGVARGANNTFWAVVKYGTSVTPNNFGIGAIQLDSLGQVLQHREFMYGCGEFSAHSVFSLPDGGIIIVGAAYDYFMAGSCNGTEDLIALRLDAEGNVIWQQVYVMPQDQVVSSAGLYPNNKFCIGYAQNDNQSVVHNRVAFIDLNTGALLYIKQMPDGKYMKCFPLRDGSFLVAGIASATGYNGFRARVDANFNTLWTTIDNTLNNASGAFGGTSGSLETLDSCIVLLAQLKTYDSTRFCFDKIRLSDGQRVWRKMLTSPVPTVNYPPYYAGYALGANQDVYAFGTYMLSNVTLSADFYTARYTNMGPFVQPSDYCSDSLRANFTGSWVGDTLRLYNTSNSGMALQDSVDCQWLIGGSTVSIDTAINMQISPSAHPNGLPVTLVITNFWGCKDTLTATVTPQGIVGNKPVQKGVFVGEAYPNPASNSVSVNYGLPSACKSAVVRMSEVGTGKVLIEQEMSLTDNALRLNTAPLAAGMYVLQVYADGAPLGVRKVSVVK